MLKKLTLIFAVLLLLSCEKPQDNVNLEESFNIQEMNIEDEIFNEPSDIDSIGKSATLKSSNYACRTYKDGGKGYKAYRVKFNFPSVVKGNNKYSSTYTGIYSFRVKYKDMYGKNQTSGWSSSSITRTLGRRWESTKYVDSKHITRNGYYFMYKVDIKRSYYNRNTRRTAYTQNNGIGWDYEPAKCGTSVHSDGSLSGQIYSHTDYKMDTN